MRLRRAAAAILKSGLAAADPSRLLATRLRRRGRAVDGGGVRHDLTRGRVVVVAVGKAAVGMAQAAAQILGDAMDSGLVVTNATAELAGFSVLETGHPLPDARGVDAALAVEKRVRQLVRDDLLIVLLSGGASALLPAPAPGITLADKTTVTAQLLRAGATIHELNTVRKHLSRLKGGGLARAAGPARLLCFALSDVVGDDLSTIASGPTVPDPTTFADALAILGARGLRRAAPAAVRRHLEAGARGRLPETPKPGDAAFARATTIVIGSNSLSLDAAAREARRHGLRTVLLTARLEGEAREVSQALTAILRECAESGRPVPAPVCLLAGGETTVTVRGGGRGGRNQELVLGAVPALASFPRHAVVASLATDGIDGASEAAGAVADQQSQSRARGLGLAPPSAFLAQNDSRSFLATLGDLIVTGPTGTNVADLTVLLAGDRIARL
jgi:glycerate 2-kinase